MSDIHFEFQDNPIAWIQAMDPTDVDVLALCGDIDSVGSISMTLSMICDRYKDAEVLYVPGNHEFYGTSLDRFALQVDADNFTWLKRGVVKTINGQRFLGDTLWYPTTPSLIEHYQTFQETGYGWSDFRYIETPQRIMHAATMTAQWLECELEADDIVLTHMLPSFQCVAMRWRFSASNMFFVHDLRDLIIERKPKLWLHGHTHDSIDVVVGDTRIVCNPFGYEGQEPNAKFNPRFLIDV